MSLVSLQAKFIAITGPLTLIGVMTLIAWGERQTYVEAHARVEEKLAQLSANQTIVLSRSLAKDDQQQVTLTAAGLIADPDVVFVRIADNDGQPISELGQADPDGIQKSSNLQFVRDGTLVRAGTLAIGITFAPLKAALLNKIRLTAVLALFLAFTLWLGNYLAFRWFVGSPLAHLHKVIENWRAGVTTSQAPSSAQDELGVLSRAFFEMKKTVTDREADLRAMKNDLEVRVEARTAELARRAFHDNLTKLPNRSFLHKTLDSMLKESAATQRPLAVAHIDLDRFKEVNDTFGHAAGDEVLVEASNRMIRDLGESCFLARVGGDEFVFLAPVEKTSNDIVDLASNLIRTLSRPMVVGDVECSIGASIGIAISDPGSSTATQLLIDSDIALYEVKRAGRGAVSLFAPSMGELYKKNQKLINDLRFAVDTRNFAPHFQPQVSLHDGAVCGFELLARWPHPTEGLLLPAQFLPLAEEAGLTAHIDMIVLEKGLEVMRGLRDRGIQIDRLSINASSKSLSSPDFPDEVLFILDRYELEPADLAIEILEETLIAESNHCVIDCLKRLHSAGLRIELDDFGTGYAALSNLATLNLTAIKLDKSLVMPLPDTTSEAIVRAMVALCAELDLQIIAEGIETEDQMALVHALGCHIGQGYGIAKPMPPEKLEDWLTERPNPLADSRSTGTHSA